MGTAPHGHFVELNVASGVMVDLGSPSSTESYIWQVAVGSDNLIYGGTYPNCKLVRLDPATGAMADLGRLDPTQSYARYLTASSNGYIYAGIGSSAMNVAAYQISSGQVQEVLPTSAQTVGFAKTFEGADSNSYVIAGTLKFQLSGWTTPVPMQTVPAPFPQNVLNNGQQISVAVSGGQLVATILNPDGTTKATFNVAYAGEPGELFRIGIGPDGNLYGSGATPIDIVRFGLPSGAYSYIGAIGNGEAYSFLPFGSNLLIGTYAANTTLFSYNPAQPFSAVTGSANPQPVLSFAANTSWRPEAMIANGDGTVSVGVVAGYGLLTGPLLLWNPTANTVQPFPVVTDQSVVSLALANGVVVGGTSIYGGLGTQPTQTSAVLFEWAPSTQTVLSETTPITGAKAITDLIVAPNGLVYGIADSSLFEFDPVAQAVTRTNALPVLHPIYNAIATDTSGRLWGLAQEGVFNVDVPSLSATVVASPPAPISGGFGIVQNTMYLISGSSVYSYQIPAATPVFGVVPGTYTSAQTVTITDTTPGAVIYYTTDGSVPTTGSTVYSGPITVATSETVQAIATASSYSQSAVASAAYTITPPAATPVFSIAPGTYTAAQTVAITNTTPGAVIYYTTNGSVPTTGSALYSGTITVSTSETVQAIATASGYSQSAVASAAYTITPPAATPVFSVASGTYPAAQTVGITDTTPGAVIYYTTDGSVPTTSSAIYSVPITVSTSETVQAIATANGYSTSALASSTFTIKVTPTMVVSPASITYGTASATLGTNVQYTGAAAPTGGVTLKVDSGASPTATCTGAASPLVCTVSYGTATLAAGSHTITASVAADANYNAASNTGTLTVTQAAPNLVVSPASITYGTASATLGANVQYTGASAPTGAVSLKVDSGAALTATCTGAASPLVCTVSYGTAALAAGSHTITATVAADTNYSSASNTGSLTVTQAAPAVVVSPASITYGTASATLGANVQYTGASAPTGAVSLKVDSGSSLTAKCTGAASPLSCTVSYGTGTLTAGSHTMTVTVAADANYIAATNAGTLTVTQAAPTLVISPVSVHFGTASATLSAKLQYTGATAPTGAVSLKVDSGAALTARCAGTASPLSCTVSYATGTLSIGTHTITGTVAADSNYSATSNTGTLTVTLAVPTLAVASVSIKYGTASATLSVNVQYAGATAPTGAVSLKVDSGAALTAKCTGTASPLVCTVSDATGTLPAGNHTITATIAADANFSASSKTGTLTVTKAAPTLVVSPVSIKSGTASAILSVSVQYAGAAAPTGAVSMKVDSGSSLRATCTGAASPLSCTVSYGTGTLSIASHTITATIASDANYSSVSKTGTLTVTQ